MMARAQPAHLYLSLTARQRRSLSHLLLNRPSTVARRMGCTRHEGRMKKLMRLWLDVHL